MADKKQALWDKTSPEDTEIGAKAEGTFQDGERWYTLQDKLLGCGPSGDVYKGIRKQDQLIVAIKISRVLPRSNSDAETGHANAELGFLQTCPKHEHIVEYLDCAKLRSNNIWIITEYCQGGNLLDYLKGKRLTVNERAGLMLQMAKGLAHLHRQKKIHRDIRPENIMVQLNEGKAVVKLGGFGYVANVNVYGALAAGGREYRAPEVNSDDRSSRCTQASDVFSLGLVFAALIRLLDKRKMSPYLEGKKDSTFYVGALMRKEGEKCPELFTPTHDGSMLEVCVKHLCANMTRLTPAKRIAIDQVVSNLEHVQKTP